MQSNKIKNVVFDIGNVIVRWSPLEIIRLTFGDKREIKQLASKVFQSDIWVDLDKGLVTEKDAKLRFQEEFFFSSEETEQFFYYVKHTQLLIFGTVGLIERIKNSGYSVYVLTNNVVETVDFLKSNYNFWPLFDGGIVSAEEHCVKPSAEIYNCLLSKYEILASESVFIDDMFANISAAKSLGFSGIQFESSPQCELELKKLGLVF